MRVSVVVPAYNAGEFVEEAIRSVLQQEHQAAEIVVVNDGSTDRDYSDLEKLSSLVRVVTQENRGVSAARNVGCELSTGEYVAILDADDMWLPGKLQAQVAHLASYRDVDAAFSNGLNWHPRIGNDAHALPRIPVRSARREPEALRLTYADFLLGIPVAPSTMVVRKSSWLAIGGFDESRRYAEDQDFNLRLSRRFKVDVLKMAGVLYRKHASSATARIQDANHWADLVGECIAKYGLNDGHGISADKAAVSRHLSSLHFLHGYNHFWHGSFVIARREFRRAIEMSLPNPKCVVYWLLASAPVLRDSVRRHWDLLNDRTDRPAQAPEITAFGDIGDDRELLITS